MRGLSGSRLQNWQNVLSCLLGFRQLIKSSGLLSVKNAHGNSYAARLISLSSKFQKNICFKMRALDVVNINTKECKGSHYL